MPTYLEIAVNVPQVSGVFHYHLPVELEGKIGRGCLVTVPFGSQTVQGVVLRQVDHPEVAETKAVIDLVDPAAVLTTHQLHLAEWLSKHTLAPLSACIHLMLPPGLAQQTDTLYFLNKQNTEQWDYKIQAKEKPPLIKDRLVKMLARRGALRGRQIDEAFPNLDWRTTARQMVKQGLISTQSVLPPPRVHPKHARTVRLSLPPGEIEKYMSGLGKPGSAAQKRRQAILRVLLRENTGIEVTWLYAQTGGKPQDLSYLEELGLISLGESEILRDPLANVEFVVSQPPSLTSDQDQVLQVILQQLHCLLSGKIVSPVLLHGVTGSGKTEIYLRLVHEVIQLKKQALILVPEIALTPQTIRRFMSRFPGQVGLVHSALSPGERYDTWRRARAGQIPVIVGPRSALFSPIPDPGLIVVDECHDDSYYQSDVIPHYHAREAAMVYAEQCKALCILGSATPDIVTYAQASNEHIFRSITSSVGQDEEKLSKLLYLHLPNRILAHQEAVRNQLERLRMSQPAESRYHPLEGQAESIDLPPVQVVDMREELKSGNRSIFSLDLQNALEEVLHLKQQAILFINRRGTSTHVFCRACGTILKCPQCDLPLIYHQSMINNPPGIFPPTRKQPGIPAIGETRSILTCHHCGYERNMPNRCPQCASTQIRQFGTGTERVEAEVQRIFPHARTLRWDWETTRRKGAHEVILGHFIAGRADVLIGTQMLAKGLDLPLVTLVGVVLADVGLGLPDYTAGERTFQLLTQVAGRAGRSPLGGRVILQTFQPEHYVIRAAAHHDYFAFANQELIYRRQLGYPPYSRLVRLEYRHRDRGEAEKVARDMSIKIKEWIKGDERRLTTMIGPVPPFYARLGGVYRWQIVLRGPNPASILRLEARLRLFHDWHIEVDPPSLL